MILESKVLTKDNAEILREWCGGTISIEHDALDNNVTQPGINVPVGDGAKRASVNDMIVRHDDGTFDVFKNQWL